MRGHFLRTAHDADALKYSLNVQTADAQPLEADVHWAKNQFVLYTKADGNWNAIKASCILAGARTLAGALVPLAGTAPTRFGTAGGWNYNRKTGLAGNGTDNYLETNRPGDADAQNNRHLAVFPTTALVGNTALAGNSGPTPAQRVEISEFASGYYLYRYLSNTIFVTGSVAQSIGTLVGVRRNNSASFEVRSGGTDASTSVTSNTPAGSGTYVVFAKRFEGPGAPRSYSNVRVSFYSIGESLGLALLDARATRLMNAFAAAIP